MAVDTQGSMNEIGQDSKTYDCGYFAGVAMSLRSLSAQFSQEEVYMMRNSYLGPKRAYEGPSGLPRQSLHEGEATSWLGFLGLAGYKTHNTSSISMRAFSEKGLAEILNEVIGPVHEARGMLVNLGEVHWVAVIGKTQTGRESTFHLYNPAVNAEFFTGDYRGTNMAKALACRSPKAFTCIGLPYNFE